MHRPNHGLDPNRRPNDDRRNRGRNNETDTKPGTNNSRNPGDNRNYNNQQRRQVNRGDGHHRQLYSRLYHNDQHSTVYFNLGRLEQLSAMNSDNVVATLAQKKNDFEKLLRNVTTPDLLVAILRVLANICRANFTEIVTSVLSHACSANFLRTLEAYLTKLPFERPAEKLKNKLYHEDKDRFWSNLLEFFRKVIEVLPSKARDELTGILETIDPISKTIETGQGYKIDQKIKEDALHMFQELDKEIYKVKENNRAHGTTSDGLNIEEDPPEDFRSLSVIPTTDDLFDHKPFIRPCKIKDRYNSVEHYLDVQFRLLREDFVAPLRSGIQEYLHGPQKYRSDELRIYKKVVLRAPEVSKKNIGITVFFGNMKYVNWARSKRFMYGGLLLLSNDNFKTILFMTVADRDEKQLRQGFVLVEPCEGSRITREQYDTNFVMLESKIYFEPYLAVLNAMQHMNERNFPMEKYLVGADTSTALPRYLLNADSTRVRIERFFAPKCRLNADTSTATLQCPPTGLVLHYKGLYLPIGEDEIWPTADDLGFDETQYRAFRSALTQEFSVIQGPPGTGKTFIALEIVRTLLENHVLWTRYGPIVVVCLTNHALDQFLEGILKYTKSIVRVGSQSKSESLNPYTLKKKRQTGSHFRSNSAHSLMRETKHELETILGSMAKARLFIKYLTTPDAIVPLSVLRKFCHDKILVDIESTEELIKWLGGNNINLLPQSSSYPIAQEPENFPETVSLNDQEADQNRCMDHELELNYKFQFEDVEPLFFPLRSMNAQITWLQQQLAEYRSGKMHALPYDPITKLQTHLNILSEQRNSLQRKLALHPVLTQLRYPTKNPQWRLYWKWVKYSYDQAMNKITGLEKLYRHTRSKLDQARQLVDLDILKENKIIGLTTNAAATLHASLRALRAPIVLVEEAAEILEAHVVSSMTKDCQHVILIGDHKQLRPKASVYKLGTKYNLNISLFERMVNIRGECAQLAHQHRMRPQIVKLITPSIYEKLYNHESVLEYPSVKGLEKNLFFLNHNNREDSLNNEDSWVNQHEAEFLVAFARHLILQGYKGTEITILCMYIGQLFTLKQEANRYAVLEQVRITSVDNYQGEENRIILLSLVRNNGEGNIGFLKDENRVCVALSRAREGLYIMGNMDDLVAKNDIWPKIKQVLEEQNAIGDSLELRCQIHSEQSIQAQNPSDFEKCPEGGCLKKCDADLPCGHICTSTCHILDCEHEKFECKQPCIKSCPNDHPCLLLCGVQCKPCQVVVERQLKCGHTVKMPCSSNPNEFPCYIEIQATLPDCDHEIKKPCHCPIEKCRCPHPCENRLPCGHTCRLTCHVNKDPDHVEYKCLKECAKNNLNCVNDHPCKRRCHETCVPCPIVVAKSRSCGHYFKQIPCGVDVEEEPCPKPCKRKLSCGHDCTLKCTDDCGKCPEKVEKRSSCGHIIVIKCSEEATPAKCHGKCQLKLACGHPCRARCKDPCTTSCLTMVRQSKPGLCGHVFSVPCYLTQTDPNSRELLKYCKEPCSATLACTHRCGGNCGRCRQGRIHIPCTQPCGNILICGHECDVPCRQECQPCKQRCNVRCRHSKCNKKCGMPCTPCKENCRWGCEHRRCTKRCSELCDIEPCNEPCKKNLKCHHPCVGFCGEPCPPLCRICNEAELTELFLGNEDEPDARFILLQDCGHCIESNGLSTWLTQSNELIQIKCCPRCKTPIRKCMRIMNQIKKDLKDIVLVKRKVFGNPKVLQQQQRKHFHTIQAMMRDKNVAEFPEISTMVQSLLKCGAPMRDNRRQILSAQEVEALRIILDILDQILGTLGRIKLRTVKSHQLVENQVVMIVTSLSSEGQISNQELNDIMPELQRLHYMVEICQMKSEADLWNGLISQNETPYNVIEQKLLSIEKFSSTLEAEIEKELNELRVSHHMKIVEKNERKMIVKAMGFSQGHWYKCPNGHIYAIADCGGANQRSKCNECGAAIGGESHRLVSGNTLAPEMDGATRSAWPGAM